MATAYLAMDSLRPALYERLGTAFYRDHLAPMLRWSSATPLWRWGRGQLVEVDG